MRIDERPVTVGCRVRLRDAPQDVQHAEKRLKRDVGRQLWKGRVGEVTRITGDYVKVHLDENLDELAAYEPDFGWIRNDYHIHVDDLILEPVIIEEGPL